MTEYTPSTKDVREGFSFYYGNEKEFLSPEWIDTVGWAGRAFERWFAKENAKTTARVLEYAVLLVEMYSAERGLEELRARAVRARADVDGTTNAE